MKIRSLLALALAAATVAATTRAARAQYGGGGFGSPGGMQPPPPMGQEPKEEGPAEEAPEDENRPADLEPLAEYAEQNRRKMQIFEVDGYLRLRTDYMHNFFMGQGYSNVPNTAPDGSPLPGLPPFPLPLGCPAPKDNPASIDSAVAGNPGSDCGRKNIGGANLRLRLEPTLNVTDQVRVHAQIDVLDNTILGSTPDSLAGIPGYNRIPATPEAGTGMVPATSLPGTAPASYLYTTQDPPGIGQNGFASSIRAKRAWGEVDTEFGTLRFGRMPWNWGRGIFYNEGGCMDCDVGTSADRVMGLTQLYGHQIMAAWDLGSQGYTTTQLNLGQNSLDGYQYDLSQDDDVLELMGAITKLDSPVRLRERIDRGDIVLNYGLQFVYREQGNAVFPRAAVPSSNGLGNPYGPQPLTREELTQASPLGAMTFTPDLWVKLYYKALTLEFEGIGIFGKVDHPGTLAVDADTKMTLRQLGWVAAGELRLYREAFFIGMETGGATGDQAESASQYLNYRWSFTQQPAGDHRLNNFHFSPDYHVDEILFRHIIGTVTNAIYVKPQASYWFDLGQTRAVGLSGALIYSMAAVPVSTPGNSLSYGAEMNVSALYRNTGEGFYAGVTWAVLWPFGALDRPAEIWTSVNAANADAAQLLRIFMGIRF